MTRAEREAAEILAEQEAARQRAPRAHAFADEIRSFLYSREASQLTREQTEKWELLACALGDHGTTRNGTTYAEINAADEAHFRAEFERLKSPTSVVVDVLDSATPRGPEYPPREGTDKRELAPQSCTSTTADIRELSPPMLTPEQAAEFVAAGQRGLQYWKGPRG